MPRSRGKPTPAKLADWEARAFGALRAQRARARSTPVDDELPEDPQQHEAETRSALRRLPPA